MSRRGHIWREPWVDCGICEWHEPCPPSIGRTSAQEARALGWSMTKQHGWVCPACVAASILRRATPSEVSHGASDA